MAYLASGRTEYDPNTDPTAFNNALTDLGLTKGLSYPDIFTVDQKYVNDPEKSMQSIFDTPPDILECRYHQSFSNTGLGAFDIAWWSHQLSESWKIRAGFDWFDLDQFYAKQADRIIYSDESNGQIMLERIVYNDCTIRCGFRSVDGDLHLGIFYDTDGSIYEGEMKIKDIVIGKHGLVKNGRGKFTDTDGSIT